MIFSDVVEAIKRFSTEEKLQIQLLLQQYLREERPEEIYQNLQASKREEENGGLTFSTNIDELKQQNISRRELMKLPIEERQKILAAQSEEMLEHYQQNQEWQELQAGDLIDY
jgi:Mg/Co/Ni transporter MgtE